MRCSLFKKLDMFGQSVQLTFRKETQFKTHIGGMASIILFIALGFMIAVKTLEYADVGNADMHEANQIASDNVIDLFDLQYRFAINKFDPRLGELEVIQIKHYNHETTGEHIKEENIIEMIDCSEFIGIDDQAWDLFLSLEHYSSELSAVSTKLLCPNIDKLEVRGHYGQSEFSYIEI